MTTKAYNETWIENASIQEIAEEWHPKKLLTDEEFAHIKSQYRVGFYENNIYLKIGLFLFTSFVSLFAFSLVVLLSNLNENHKTFAILAFIFAAIYLYILEKSIKNKHYYNNGIDNALIISSISLILLGIFTLLNDIKLELWQYYFISIPVFIIVFFRYGNFQMAIGLVACIMLTIFFFTAQSEVGKKIVPFVMMAASLAIYLLNERFKNTYYAAAQHFIKIVVLAALYLSGNYLVVREGNAILNNLNPSVQISFAPIFYIYSALMPFVFIYVGIQKKDRLSIIMGFLAFLFSIYTYRQYFSILSIEWAMLVGGSFAIFLAVWLIKLLKNTRWGLSSEPSEKSKYQEMESMILGQMLHNKSHAPETKFGEGNFGGGGTGEDY